MRRRVHRRRDREREVAVECPADQQPADAVVGRGDVRGPTWCGSTDPAEAVVPGRRCAQDPLGAGCIESSGRAEFTDRGEGRGELDRTRRPDGGSLLNPGSFERITLRNFQNGDPTESVDKLSGAGQNRWTTGQVRTARHRWERGPNAAHHSGGESWVLRSARTCGRSARTCGRGGQDGQRVNHDHPGIPGRTPGWLVRLGGVHGRRLMDIGPRRREFRVAGDSSVSPGYDRDWIGRNLPPDNQFHANGDRTGCDQLVHPTEGYGRLCVAHRERDVCTECGFRWNIPCHVCRECKPRLMER